MDARIDIQTKLSQELSQLSEIERKQITAVIQRDTDLRNNYLKQDRIKKLRQEIDLIEAESVDIPLEHVKTANFCSRCKTSFVHGLGFMYYSLLGQADSCPKCKLKVCFQCRVNQNQYAGNEYKWVCKLCDKYM